MNLTCSKTVPPLGGVLFAEYIRSQGKVPVTLEWGTNNIVQYKGNQISANSANDLCRILAKLVDEPEFYGGCALEKTEVDSWLTFSLGPILSRNDFNNGLQYLNKALGSVTYLVGKRLSIADFVVFGSLYSNKQWKGLLSKKEAPIHVLRWYNFIKAIPAINNALSALSDDIKAALNPVPTSRQSMEKSSVSGRAQEGKFVDLPGAEMGKVVVRFPPEASGYLHIGHAKAALLNQYYQQAFDGKLIMRFDDTNPAKENLHFEKVILEDVEMLEIKPDMFTHTSQYFDLMLQYCEKLLKDGKAYVDDTNGELMKEQREQKMDSVNRSNSYEKNNEMWQEMIKGTARGQQCCVRAKIDMQSPNGCMRDPTIYRCKNEPHPRTGTAYKVYPTYDFACPIVDAIEGVTHTLRTMEYHDRDAQFYWFIEALNLRKPYIWEYSRLSMTNTVLSKRKLTWFVQEGLVDGWDDPRMPTVRGVLRRGMTVEGLKQFIIAQGSSRSVVFMEWDKIWAFNKKVIDPIAPRYTAVSFDAFVPVHVKGVQEAKTTAPVHPKNAEIGNKDVWTGPKILIDKIDTSLLAEGENATFINWGNLLIKKINRNNGEVVSIEAEPNLDNKDYKKTVKLTWLAETAKAEFTPTWCVYFDHIISKPLLAKDEDFKQFIGHNTRTEVKMLGDPELKKLKKGDIIQLQRKGFFKVDEPYRPRSEFTSVEQPIILFYVPDGHTKENPTLNVSSSKVQTSNKVKDTQLDQQVKSTTTRSIAVINENIVAQGDLVRNLKTQKASKPEIDAAVKKLLDLKAEYKTISNTDWKPGCVSASSDSNSTTTGDSNDTNIKITEQGEKVRKLKSQKADKSVIDTEVKLLLALKAEFKQKSGKDWTPGSVVVKTEVTTESANDILQKIANQGETIRNLKSSKAEKAVIEPEVKILLALKAEYKSITGKDWKPGMVPEVLSSNAPVNLKAPDTNKGTANDILQKIADEGAKIRDLKANKAEKTVVETHVKTLLGLKAEYKNISGKDWKPGMVPEVETPSTANVKIEASKGTPNDILQKIADQGTKIRDLKSSKVEKPVVEAQVKILLDLKADYKSVSGKDWKPGMLPEVEKSKSPETDVKIDNVANDILRKIADQGAKIRDLKSNKSEKTVIEGEVKILLDLKTQYKSVSGKEWKPGMLPENVESKLTTNDQDIDAQIASQGDKIRQLKAGKADKETIDKEVKILLELKNKFKSLTGNEWKPGMKATGISIPTPVTNVVKEKIVKQKAAKKEKIVEDSSSLKKQTRLGIEAKKEENLSDWYSQVITKGEMIEYYDVSGCYIFRPWSFAVWEAIKDWFDGEIKKLGVQNCYFPIFVSRSVLEKEKTHIADFAPEVAWVTKSGDSDMAEPIAVRPTSETVMYPAYAKWIQSYRDLPIKLNQWNNVVRWEFKHPQPFLRTREFLWQEGHTAYAHVYEAKAEVKDILDLYAKVYTDLLAVPVVKGRKTEKEKFAGGDYTYTVEAFVSASGRAIQGATSHHLGQNFSKMFDIIYEDPDTQEKKYVYQNSWGITTRTIGVMIMIHADNKGLVIPPKVASVQVVIVPCGITVSLPEADRKDLQVSCDDLELALKNANVKVKGDYRDNYSPGWKFNHWELKGVPVRIEIGPKDIKNNQIVAVRRDTGEKITIKRDTAATDISALLDTIQTNLYNNADKDLKDHLVTLTSWETFGSNLDKKNIILAPFCGDIACEDKIKNDSARDDSEADAGSPSMGAKSLCIPLAQPAEIKASDKCIHPECKNKPQFYTLFGRSY